MSVTYQHGLFVVSDAFRKIHPEALDLIYKHNNEKKIAVLNKKLFAQKFYFLEFEQKIINMLSMLESYKFIKHTTYAFIKDEFQSCHITGPRIFPKFSSHIVADPSGKEYFSDIEVVTCPKCSPPTVDRVLWGQDIEALSNPVTHPTEEIKLEARDERLLARLRNIIAMLRDLRTSCSPSTIPQVLQPEDCIDELKVIERRLDSATSEVEKRLVNLHWDIANVAKAKLDEFDGQMDAKDTSIVTAINTDATQSVELINQAPSQENNDPKDYGTRHAITEKEMDTFEQMANRWFPIQQLVWGSQANGAVLFDYNFPSYAFGIQDFLESPNAAIFRNYRFFRFDIEFEIQVNSSKMQAGSLLCSWRYLDQYPEIANTGDLEDRFLRTQGPHSFAFCGRNSVAKLYVPYKHFFPILSADQNDGRYTIRDFFKMNILVFNYLRGGDNCNDPVTVNVQMRFVNLQKSGLFNSNGIMRGQFNDEDDAIGFSELCVSYHQMCVDSPQNGREVSMRYRKLGMTKEALRKDLKMFNFIYACYNPLPIGRKYKSIIQPIFKIYSQMISKIEKPSYQKHNDCFYAAVREVLKDSRKRLMVRNYIEQRFPYSVFENCTELFKYAQTLVPGIAEEQLFNFGLALDILEGDDADDFPELMKKLAIKKAEQDRKKKEELERLRQIALASTGQSMVGQMDYVEDKLGVNLEQGVKGALRGGLEGLLKQTNADANRDKPSDPNQFQALIPYASHSWAHGDGSEKTNILRLQPTGQTPHFQPTDEMTVKHLCSIYSGIETFNYRTIDPEGTRIAMYYVNPVAQATSRVIQPADETNNQLATYRVPSIGVVASNFAYWKGSIEFRFDFIVPFTNTGRVMIAYIPTYMLNSSLAELNDGVTYRIAKSCYNAIFDLGEETSITFRAPFYVDRAWLKTDPSELEISGIVAIFVVNRLVRFCTSSSIVDVNTFVRSGPDFELSIPIKPFLSPSFDRSYIPPSITYRTSHGEGNPAFAGLGDPSYQETLDEETYGPVIARDGGSWSNWITVRPFTNITQGDVFEFGQSKIIEWISSNGTRFQFKYGVPLLNINGVLGDSPALALFQTQEGARAFAQFQVANNSFEQGPYTRYYYTANAPRTRDTDGPPSTVVNGTVLDLLDAEMTGQMDDRHLTSIYSTPGEVTRHSSNSFFNETFSDLKTIARRYQFYSDFESNLDAGTCFGQVVARIPLRPIIRPSMNNDVCSARLYNAVRGGFIANIGSGFRFFKGSLRFKIIFNVTFIDQSAKNENEDLTFMITHVPERGAPNSIIEPQKDLPTSFNPQGYAYYGHSTRVNPICEIEIPYYSRYEYITPYQLSVQNDLDNLGYLDISLGGTVNKSVKLAMQVYYSFGDDARFSSFQGFPSMVYLEEIPQNPQQATQAVNAQTGQMDSLMKGTTDKVLKGIDASLQNFSNNLTTSLQSSVDTLLTNGDVIVGKACEMADMKMEKQQEKLFDRIEKTTDSFFDKMKITSEEIVQNSMKQCMEVAEKMGLKDFGLHWGERLVNIVASVGHVLLNPTIKSAILSFVQILMNMGLILAEKITDTFQSLVKFFKADKIEKNEQDGQFEGEEAMISSFATILVSAAGLSLGKSKGRAVSYASGGLRLFKDFSLASNSFSTWIKNNLNWITSFLKWAKLVDTKMELNHEIIEKYDSLKEWLTETNRILQIPIHRIESDQNLILKVYTLAWKADSYMTMECSDVGKLPIHHNIRHLSMELYKLRDQLLSSSFSPPIGVEPFVICLAGPPGFGKSELLAILSDRLIRDIGFKCSGNTSYIRGFTPYWNNAGNQPNVIIDEVGANKETMEQFVQELFSMKSRSVFNPDFAHLEDKRRVFNPISIIMGTNFPFWDVIPTGANSLTALHRRRDALWEVMPDFKDVPNTTADQMAAMAKKKKEFATSSQTTMDFSHLKFRLCVNPEAQSLHEAKWNRWISYEEFYRVNLSMFKQHRLKEIKMVRAALERTYEQRMSFMEGNEEESNGLQNFFDKIMNTPKGDLLAKLGTFNDPSLTATSGRVKVDDDDYKTILNKAYDTVKKVKDQDNEPTSQDFEGQADKPKIAVSEVRKPVDGPETVLEDATFEAHLNYVPEKPEVKEAGTSAEERPYLDEAKISKECPHQILRDKKLADILYSKEEAKEVFTFAPDFKEEDQVDYRPCDKNCFLFTKRGVMFKKDWIDYLKKFAGWTKDSLPEEFSGHFSKRKTDEELPSVKNLEKGKKTLLEKFKDFFSNFSEKWKRVARIVGWITLACSIVGVACLLYHKLTQKSMEGNMKFDNIAETTRIINEYGAFKKTKEYKDLLRDDPEAAQAIARQMLIQAQVVPPNLFGEYAGSVKSYDSSVHSNSTRSSYNSLLRKSSATRRWEEQGGQSEQLESLISLIQGNLSRIVVEVNGTEKFGINTCGLYDRSAFLMRHQIKTLQALKNAGVKVQLWIERNIGGQLKRYEFSIDDVKVNEKNKEELVLFRFPKSMPSFKNIIKHIATERTVVPSSCYMTWMDKKGRVQRQIVQVNRQNYTQTISSDDLVPYRLEYDQAVSYNFGGPGLCGTPLISMTSAPKILGFHCGGLGEKQGSSQRVYQSDFSPEIDGQYHIPEEDFCNDQPMVKLPPNLDQIGILKKDKLPGFSTKTQLIKSLMYNEIYESKKIPAPLKKTNGIDPMEKALQKLENVPTGFDPKLLQMAYESLRDDMIFQNPPILVPEETSRLTPEQCFSGIKGFTEYKKINLGTSEGYPLNLLGRDQEHRFYFGDRKLTSGKHWLFDYDLDGDGYKLKEVHPLLLTERERMNNQRASIIRGIDLGERQYAVLTLKDQKMDIEKAILGKNRIFSACPVEQSLSVREYFGHWKAAYMAHRIENSTAIGIDVNGPEWTRLALKLLDKGNNIITGDYSAFGDTLDKDCVKKVFDAINDWYDFYYPNQENENLYREALYHELINMPHIAKNVVFVRQNGIPSGFGLTVELNDNVNKMYMKLAWLSITKESLREMAQHVYYCMYGDDLIMSVSDKYIDIFNFETIQDFLFQHNITFTPATKDEFSYKSQPLSKSTFLKGNFVEHPQSTLFRPIYLCKLPESSVLELLNWQWKDNDPKTFCFTACRAALQSLFTHGRKDFNRVREKMLRFFTKNRNTLFGPDDKPDLQTFEELDELFLQQFLG